MRWICSLLIGQHLKLLLFINLKEKRIVIIGASSGIGKQAAITLSDIGAKVTLVARREQQLKEVMKLLKGDGHDYFCSDISEILKIETLFKQITQKNGAIDGLIYAAGIGTAIPFIQSKPEKIRETFNVNFVGFL